MTVRAWLRWPALVTLCAVLVLVALQSVLGAGGSPRMWDFEGEEALEEDARSDLQLVAPPLHVEVGDTGQSVYQLDLSSDEPEGTLLEPEPGAVPPEPDYVAEPTVAPAPGVAVEAGAADTHAVLKQMITHRDRQVMASERDGVGAYELAAGIDQFVTTLIEAVRRSDS